MQIVNKNSQHKLSNHPPSFKAIYALRGNESEIQLAKNLILEQLRPYEYAFKPIEKQADIVTLGVGTDRDASRILENSFDFEAKSNVIPVRELLNPFKTLDFNAFKGVCTKVENFYKDGKTFICSSISGIPSGINLIKFNSPKPLFEGLKELVALPDKIEFGNNDGLPFAKIRFEQVLECEDRMIGNGLADVKITGLVGRGSFSTVFGLTDNKCLKLSSSPNAPLEDEPFDIPTLQKGKVELKEDDSCWWNRIYYAVQKRGFNIHEYNINNKHLEELRKQITEIYPDSSISSFDFHPKQIAMLDGKPYLVDAEVVDRPLFE